MSWILSIDLRPEVGEYNAGKLTIEQLAEKVALRLLGSGWDKLTAYPDTLRDHTAYLRNSLTESDYEWRWEPLYDLADSDRVLITTGG
jgi:hypothetical protein